MSVEDERKLFVAGLAEAVSEDVLRQLFEAAGGQVESVTIPRDRGTGKPRGFGFVTMCSEDEARVVREALDGSMQAGRSISVRIFRADRSSPPPSRNAAYTPPADDATLYIGNLPFDANSEEIGALFGEAGFEVQRVHLPVDPEGRPRGFGFVALTSADDARGASEQLQFAMLRGRRLSVSVARARGAVAPPRVTRSNAPESGGGAGPSSTREPMSFRSPPVPNFPPNDAPPSSRSWEEAGRSGPSRDSDKTAKKRKVKGATAERGPQRRKNEGFRAPRACGMMDDWDDD